MTFILIPGIQSIGPPTIQRKKHKKQKIFLETSAIWLRKLLNSFLQAFSFELISVSLCGSVANDDVTMDINELTYKINGAVFEVNRILGAGFLEKVYENALMVEFKLRGLNTLSQVPISVHFKGEVVGEYFADIVVEDQIILELKASNHHLCSFCLGQFFLH